MKQIYMSVLLVMLFTVNVFGEQHASKFGEKEKVAVVYENNVFLKAEPRNSVDDALGCPPNTVLSGAFSRYGSCRRSYQILPILFWMLSESERNSLVREIHVLGRRKLRVVVLRRPWRHR